MLGVGSWDHLTTKGLIHERPDRMIVWNEAQRVEAAELHRDPARHGHGHRRAGLRPLVRAAADVDARGVLREGRRPADRPLLLYLCSSPFITPYESRVRAHVDRGHSRIAPDPELRVAAILIRPHPQNAAAVAGLRSRRRSKRVGIWPRAGANPVDTDARADYYDSMFHSVAVVGVNTSALIESGIVGRPVFTVLADEFAGQQEGTLHFQHLKNVNGGLLHGCRRSLEEHCAQLAAGRAAARRRAMLRSRALRPGVRAPARARRSRRRPICRGRRS